jgi:hypothetical protein
MLLLLLRIGKNIKKEEEEEEKKRYEEINRLRCCSKKVF